MRVRDSGERNATFAGGQASLAAAPQHEQATPQSAAETLARTDLEPGRPFNPYRRFLGILIPDAIVKSEDLPAGAKLCYARLMRYAGENGCCFPSMRTLASELGVTERAARKYVRQLERAGLLRRRSQPGKTNWFEFLWDPRLQNSLMRNDCTSKGRNNYSGQAGINVPPKRKKEESRRQENQFLINLDKNVRVHPLGDDRTEEALKYASERDELIALIEESTKTSPDQKAIRTIQEWLEVGHGNLRAYLDDIRPRLKRLRRPPTISFFVSQAQQWNGEQQCFPQPRLAADTTLKPGRCADCAGTGRKGANNEEYCTCALGLELERIERRKARAKDSSQAEGSG